MMAARAVTAQPGTRSCAATLSLGFVKYLVVSRGSTLYCEGAPGAAGRETEAVRAGVCDCACMCRAYGVAPRPAPPVPRPAAVGRGGRWWARCGRAVRAWVRAGIVST